MKKGNLIGYKESIKGIIEFQTLHPKTNTVHPNLFVEATSEEVEESVTLAKQAFRKYSNLPSKLRAEFLSSIASELENNKEKLINIYQSESGYEYTRGEIELKRTIQQLLSFAQFISNESWKIVHNEPCDTRRKPTPKPSLRKEKIGLGPIVVFGASNFPFAYSTAGGDTAAALAAGCPVIVKSHPYHANTSYTVAKIIQGVAENLNLPEGVFTHLNASNYSVGKQLVQHPFIQGVGFTGSIRGGLAIQALANQRKIPIPVFAEMGSLNPVVVLPSALPKNTEEIAQLLCNSITQASGQFCTKPGAILLLKAQTSIDFISKISETFKNTESYSMVHPSIAENYYLLTQRLEKLEEVTRLAVGKTCTNKNFGLPILSMCSGKSFREHEFLQEEVFGPHSMIVLCENFKELTDILEDLSGQLTLSFFHDENIEIMETETLYSIAKEKCGRIIQNGVPTGVEVSPAMQHGGPFPSSSDSRFTAVGIDAIDRFTRHVTYQNF